MKFQLSNKLVGSIKKIQNSVVKDWLETSSGVEPKIWQTLLDKLEEIEEFYSIIKKS